MNISPRRRTLLVYFWYTYVALVTVFFTHVAGFEWISPSFDPHMTQPPDRSLLADLVSLLAELGRTIMSRGSITMLCLFLYVGATGMLLSERASLTSADADPVVRPMTGRTLVLDVVFLVLPCLLAGACFWFATGLAQAGGLFQWPASAVALVPWVLGVALVEGFAAMSARSRDGSSSGMGHDAGRV